jgi:hypothetical protein
VRRSLSATVCRPAGGYTIGGEDLPRRLLLLVAALGATVAALVGPGVAQAHWDHYSSGCTGASGGATCYYVYGNAGTTHVDHFLQSRDVVFPQICNYQAKFTVAQNNSVYWTKWSDFHNGCFYSIRATRSSGTVEKNFRNPSIGCGSWYENGSRMGTACLAIFKS